MVRYLNLLVVFSALLLSSCLFDQGTRKSSSNTNLAGSDTATYYTACLPEGSLPEECTSCDDSSGNIVYTCANCSSMSFDSTFCSCDSGIISCVIGSGDDEEEDDDNNNNTATVATPSFNIPGGTYAAAQTVSLSSATSGASIHYVIGTSTPTCNSTIYTNSLVVSSSSTIKAIACKTGMTASAVASASYVINLSAVSAPTFSPLANTYSSGQSVSVSTVTSGSTIKYTTDGSAPTCSSGTTYSSAIWVPSTMTIKAIACKTGMTNSAVASGTYTINLSSVSAPTFSPVAGTFNTTENVYVSMGSSTSGSTIYYTTNGSNPDCAVGTTYSSGQQLTISSTTTIKAIACKSGFNKSSVSTGTFTIVSTATCSGSCPSASVGTTHPTATCTSAMCGTQTSTRSCKCHNRPQVWSCDCDTWYGPH